MPAATHGLTTPKYKLGHKVYLAWNDIKRRCFDKNNKWYASYGARGINLQESWKDDPVLFYNYVSCLENFSEDRSLDRIDNNLGYIEGNLRWATKGEQVRNRSKNRNNSSGYCAVTWYYNETGGTRSIAWWSDPFAGKVRSKSFPVKIYGLLEAFALACEYREAMITKLNKQGVGYTSNHGN